MLKRLLSRTKNKESGQTIVELAICLPLLITILCGILDFGWVYLNEYEVNHAAYEATRYAAMHVNDPGMTPTIMETNVTALVRNNLSHEAQGLTVSINGLYLLDFPAITVSMPVHMLTYVGSLYFGTVYDITVTNTFSA